MTAIQMSIDAKRAERRLESSVSKYPVAAICYGSDGFIGITCNRPRFHRHGGSVHAEMAAMLRWKGIRSIVLIRVTSSGKRKPIHPCEACQRKADELGIRIIGDNGDV